MDSGSSLGGDPQPVSPCRRSLCLGVRVTSRERAPSHFGAGARLSAPFAPNRSRADPARRGRALRSRALRDAPSTGGELGGFPGLDACHFSKRDGAEPLFSSKLRAHRERGHHLPSERPGGRRSAEIEEPALDARVDLAPGEHTLIALVALRNKPQLPLLLCAEVLFHGPIDAHRDGRQGCSRRGRDGALRTRWGNDADRGAAGGALARSLTSIRKAR